MNKRKVIRGILFLLAVPMAAMGVFIGFHGISLQIERRKFPPIGKLVEVNGHQMHVYSEGEGGETLVFLSGSGTAAPALDFKALYSRLAAVTGLPWWNGPVMDSVIRPILPGILIRY